MSLNIVLDDKRREEYSGALTLLQELTWETFKRKPLRANVQQAFCFKTVRDLNPSSILCVGSYEDTACEALQKLNFNCKGIDPATNGQTLEQLIEAGTDSYECVFSCSVLEHVIEDHKFIEDLCKVSNKYVILTFDWNPNWEWPQQTPITSLRFYNKDRIFDLLDIFYKNGFEAIDTPEWEGDLDFEWEGHKYAFATMVMVKT